MARFVHLHAPLQRTGTARAARATTLCRATAVGALLLVLTAIGSLALRAAARLRRGYAAWAQARRLRAQDRLLRELACTDSRIMADLIAVSQHMADEGGKLVLR